MIKEQKEQIILKRRKLCEVYTRTFATISTNWERANLIGIIYRIVNLVNGKSYIGQTINWFNNRYAAGKWWEHTDNPLLKAAVEKYGLENFEVRILEYNIETIEELNFLEIKYIAEYKTFVDDGNGYNLNRGGENRNCLQETRNKISKAMIGRKFSQETLLKMSKANSGENNPNYGKEISLETKEKLSKAFAWKNHPMFGKKMNPQSVTQSAAKHKIPVIQISIKTDKLIKVWDSAADAGKSLFIDRAGITRTCKGKCNSAGKFKWKYYNKSDLAIFD